MHFVESNQLGTLLRQYRRDSGLTQAELAERAGISVRSVSDMERGVSRWPHRDTVALLAGALRLAAPQRLALEQAARRPRSPFQGGGSARWLQNTLLVAPTPLIGREHEEAALVHLLIQEDVRLVTLTGPPGVGKTRLGMQVANALGAAFADGVAVISLADVHAPEMVVPVIAQVLGVHEAGRQSIVMRIASALQHRHMLLLLDNFEQVLAAAPALAEMLAACPGVKLLVTSRTALGLRAEQEFPVSPLATPDPAHLPSRDDLARYPAVALFVHRARAVMPLFELNDSQALAIAAICARLDGLPLAIELIAPWVKLFAPTALLARLNGGLLLLSDGARDLPPRQRTLEDAIAWSYDLLSEREQRLFRHLAVFAGGWILEAAEAVCDAFTTSNETLAGLASLVNKSLVLREESAEGVSRFRLLEPIREFGRVRLSAMGEESEARQRHFEYYLGLAEAAFAELRGPAQAVWLRRLEGEHDSIRAALDWALMRNEAEMGLRLAFALYLFWRKRGHLREGQRWLEALLALPAAKFASAAESARPGATGSATVIDDALRGRALFAFAAVRLWQLDVGGLAALEEGLAIFRTLGDVVMIADGLHAFGKAACELGDEARGGELLNESLALSRSVGERWSIAQTLWTLGEVAFARGDIERAEDYNTESLELFRQVGDVSYVAVVTLRAGYIAYAQGDIGLALLLYREAFDLARSLDDIRGTVESLEAMAILESEHGHPESAVHLLSIAARMRETAAEAVRPSLRIALGGATARLRTTLGQKPFTAAWNVGRTDSLDNIIAEVIAKDARST